MPPIDCSGGFMSFYDQFALECGKLRQLTGEMH